MKITHVEAIPVRIPVKPARHMVTALGKHTVSKYVVVRVGTDAGIEGVGEATVMPNWSGETVWGAAAVLDHILGPCVIGADPTDLVEIDRRMDSIIRHNWFAKSAIEMACWDIAGKAAGKPVFELLGGAVRPLTIRCRFSMGAYEPERAEAGRWNSSAKASRRSKSKSAGSRRKTSNGFASSGRRSARNWL